MHASHSTLDLLWQRCSKESHSGRDYLDFAAADAVLHFNEGKNGRAKIYCFLGLEAGQHSCAAYRIAGTRRVVDSRRRSEDIVKTIKEDSQ